MQNYQILIFIIMIIAGTAAGYLEMLLSKNLIAARATGSAEFKLVSGKYVSIIWCIATAAFFGLIQNMNISIIQKTEALTVFLICLAVAAVDFTVRKIPNILILALIICKAVFLGLNYSSDELIKSLLGLAVAGAVFILPALFGLSTGAGDIKFAAITGLYLGITGFLQAMVIMAVLITVYGFYIIITKKGNFKSKTSMGPYLALGMFCSLLYPIF